MTDDGAVIRIPLKPLLHRKRHEIKMISAPEVSYTKFDISSRMRLRAEKHLSKASSREAGDSPTGRRFAARTCHEDCSPPKLLEVAKKGWEGGVCSESHISPENKRNYNSFNSHKIVGYTTRWFRGSSGQPLRDVAQRSGGE